MSGARFACDDKDMARLVELLKQTFAGIAVSTQPYYAFPFLRHLPGLTDFYKIVKDFQRLQDFFKVNLVVILIPNIFQDFWNINSFFQAILENRRRIGTYKNVQNDFIDSFLQKVDEYKDNPNKSSTDDTFTGEHEVKYLQVYRKLSAETIR